MLFHRKKRVIPYDKEKFKPVILASICTGEMTVGFQNRQTGVFTGECMVKTEAEIQAFQKKYGITEDLEKIY